MSLPTSSAATLMQLYASLEPFLAYSKEETSAFYFNPFTFQVYDGKGALGKMWKCVYQLGEFLTGVSIEKTTRWKEIASSMKALWQTSASYIKQTLEAYHEHRSGADPLHAKVLQQVIDICEPNPLFRFFLTEDRLLDSIQKINLNFFRCFGVTFFAEEDIRLLHRMSDTYSAAALAGILQRPIPAIPLHSLADDIPLSGEEKTDLADWLESIQQQASLVTPLFLHTALRSVVDSIVKLGKLERQLLQEGLYVLRDQDSVWNSYLRCIYPGARIHREVTVGAKINSTSYSAWKIQAYEEKEKSESMLLVAEIPTALYLFYSALQNSWGVQPHKIIPYGKRAFFATAEKISYSLDAVEWTSVSDTVSSPDCILADKIASLVRWIATQERMPRDFTADKLAVTRQGTIVSRIPMALDDSMKVEYKIIEQFVQSCSRDNIFIFRYIMRQSGLHVHPCAQAVRKAIAAVLQKSAHLHSSIPEDPDADVWSVSYCLLVRDLFDGYRSQIEEVHWIMIYKMVVEKLIERLEHNAVAVTLWKDQLLEQVKQSLEDSLCSMQRTDQKPKAITSFPAWFHMDS